MNTAVNKPTQQHPWKVGEQRLKETRSDIHKLLRLLQLIAAAEEEHTELMAYSREAGQLFPELRSKSIHEAHVRIHQLDRLHRFFNNIANEIHLL